MICRDKQYRTRGGLNVTILAYNARGSHSVVGLIHGPGEDYTARWNLYGEPQCHMAHKTLEEVKPRIYYWMNVYPNGGMAHTYKTRKEADNGALPSRVACVLLDVPSGEGLDD